MTGFDLSTISDVYVGNTQYNSIYYGHNLVWEKVQDTLSLYVQDGLIFHLDYISPGTGSDWTDLIGGILFVQNGNEAQLTNNGYYFANSNYLNNTSTITDINNSSDSYTVELCYRPETSSNKYYVFGTGGGRNSHNPMFINDSGYITWGQSSNRYKDTYITNNSKNTISLNSDRSVLNGVVVPKESNTDYWDTGSTWFRIGRANSGSFLSFPFSGYIYSIRIYNRKLTEQELLQNQSVDNLRFNLGLSNL